jgi:hypothetical protein
MRYKTLKDTPDGAKAGTLLRLLHDGKYHVFNIMNGRGGWVPYERHIVENNPDWFQLIEDVRIIEFGWVDGSDIPERFRGFHFKTSGGVIRQEQYNEVIRTIENLLN